ncbi:MAG: 2-C-methyl-D-erythritol 4-phosphate cytidylyltransferase, partial [Gemella sp.]
QILTDACKIFVIKGKKVALAKGEYSNIKITTVTDLKIAKSMLEDE